MDDDKKKIKVISLIIALVIIILSVIIVIVILSNKTDYKKLEKEMVRIAKEKVETQNIEVKIQDISFADADGNATDALKDANFKYSFLYNNSEIASGNFEGFTGNELILEDNLSITKDSVNNFELRLWVEDNGGDQSNMENKTFTGTIAVTVISR